MKRALLLAVSLLAVAAFGQAPTVTTTPIKLFADTIARGAGTVTSIGGSNPTDVGVCYGPSANPTTPCASMFSSYAGGATATIGTFSGPIISLTPSTLYHYRAFATNSTGTSYGSDMTFTTTASGVPYPTLPSSSEGTITTSDWRTFAGTVMNTNRVTQNGAILAAHNASDFTHALANVKCGDTIVLDAQNTGNTFVAPTSAGWTLPATTTGTGTSGWIYVQTSDLSSLHPEHTRVATSASDMAVIRPHLALIKGAHLSTSPDYVINYPLTSTGCKWRFIGVEVQTDGSGGETYTIGSQLLSGFMSVAIVDEGDHLVLDQVWAHGTDDIGYNATGCSITSNLATVTASQNFNVGDTNAYVTGFTGACSFLNNLPLPSLAGVPDNATLAYNVSAVGTFASGTITTIACNTPCTTVTVTFSPALSAPPAVGDIWDIRNANPIQFGGLRTVLASPAPTTTSFAFSIFGQRNLSGTYAQTTTTARNNSTTFSFPFTHADLSFSSDTGYVIDRQSPNILSTGARRDMQHFINLFNGRFGASNAGATFFALLDSWITEVHSFAEAQTVLGLQTSNVCPAGAPGTIQCSGPFKIVNNLLSSAGENILFGGAAIGNFHDQVHDIEVRNNWFWNDPNWLYMGATHTGYTLVWVQKTNFETKNANYMLFTGNILHHSWAPGSGGDNGTSYRGTQRSTYGNFPNEPNSAGNFAFVNNVFIDANWGFTLTGGDPSSCYLGNATSGAKCSNFGFGDRFLFQNNLIKNRDQGISANQAGNYYTIPYIEGFYESTGPTNVDMEHNTVWDPGSTTPYADASLSWNALGGVAYVTGMTVTGDESGVCSGTGYAVGDVLTVDPTVCTGAALKVNVVTVGAGGCVKTTSVNAEPNGGCGIPVESNGTGLTGIQRFNVSTTDATTPAASGFKVNVIVSPLYYNHWVRDNIWGQINGATGGRYGQISVSRNMATPSAAGPYDLLHRFAGNYTHIYPFTRGAANPYQNTDCGPPINPTNTALSNCQKQGTGNFIPSPAFAFNNASCTVTQIALGPIPGSGTPLSCWDYALTAPYTESSPYSGTPSGAVFNGPGGLLPAIQNTMSGLACSGPVTVVNTTLSNGAVGESYVANLSAQRGTPPYSNWTVSSGALPSWATLVTNADGTGTISGILLYRQYRVTLTSSSCVENDDISGLR